MINTAKEKTNSILMQKREAEVTHASPNIHNIVSFLKWAFIAGL